MSASAVSTKPSVEITVDTLPAIYTTKGATGLGVFLMLFAAFWGGLPTVLLVKCLTDNTFEPGMLLCLAFTVAGVAIFFAGLNQCFREQTVTLDEREARVDKRSIFGRTQWSEPLANYEGIMARTEARSRNDSSYTVYLLDLHHIDTSKTVRLYEAQSPEGWRERLEHYCRALGMPAVEESSGGLIKRDVTDLDKSVRELVQEKKLRVEFDPSAPVPRGLAAAADEESGALVISILRKRFSPLGAVIGFVLPAAFFYIGFFLKDGPIVFGVLGILIGLLVLAALAWECITRRHIRLAKDEVHAYTMTPWGPTPGKRVNAAEVEMVKVGRGQHHTVQGVVIATDQGEVVVGAGLGREELEWLRNCILAVVTK
jgi:hypothetical protein